MLASPSDCLPCAAIPGDDLGSHDSVTVIREHIIVCQQQTVTQTGPCSKEPEQGSLYN